MNGTPHTLLANLNLLASAPDGVARLRELILTLAVQGKLVPQDPNDEPANELLKKIRAEKNRLIAEGKIKRDKPLAEIGEEEEPFELPVGWEWVRIPEISYGLGQGEPRTSFSYIDVAAIDNAKGRVAREVQVLEAADAPSRARKYVAQGTVIYSTVRPYLKNIAVVEQEYQPRAIASTAFAVMHPHTGVLSQYLLHYLRSQPFTEFVNSKAVGVAYPAINDANFFQGVVPLPPLAEQARIVARVEELMRLCDALEAKGRLEATQHAQLVATLLAGLTDCATAEELAEHWQRVAEHFDLLFDRPEAVDALEQTILQLAVRGQLVPQDPNDEPASELLKKIRAEKDRLVAEGKIKRDKPLPPIADEEKPFELPNGWVRVRMGHLIELVSGQHLGPSEYLEGPGAKVPYLTGPAEFGAVTPMPSRSTNERRAIAIQHDILITVKGSGVGKLNVVTQRELAISRQLMAIRPLTMDCEFLMVVLQTMALHFQERSIGIAIPGIGREDVTHAAIGLPPLAEQSRIVARVTSLRALCADLRERLTAARVAKSRFASAAIASA